jgi:hypothetical protein
MLGAKILAVVTTFTPDNLAREEFVVDVVTQFAWRAKERLDDSGFVSIPAVMVNLQFQVCRDR